MKITVLSDTHNQHEKIVIERTDILIHCGDATVNGHVGEMSNFFSWFNRQKAIYKIFVPGNHDAFMESYNEIMYKGIHVLINRTVDLCGLRISGSPFFSRPKRVLKERRSIHDSFRILYTLVREKIHMEDCDIRITHSPPYGILDLVEGSRRGCEIMQGMTQEYKAKIHLFGHIHSGYGKFVTEGTTFYNAAMCDDDNELIQQPIVLSL